MFQELNLNKQNYIFLSMLKITLFKEYLQGGSKITYMHTLKCEWQNQNIIYYIFI